jgi:predicted ATPase
MDPSSRELLDRTMARLDRMPVLLVATFRPEFEPPWAGQAHVSSMALSRLGRRDGAALVRQLAGNAALAPEIVDEILERTDGVPLFLEEVTKVVLEASGTGLARDAISVIPGTRVAVPATLQASLMARLDRLGAAAREVAQTGAAIGRDFSYELLVAVAPRGEAEARGALDQLVASGLVFQRGVPPAASYQFKHALVQDTAYSTLLRGPRQALHGRIAEALEKRAPGEGRREPEILAHHLAEAGQSMRAASYWLDAGRRAAGRSANIEAIAHFRYGIEALASLAEDAERLKLELPLQLALGPALMANQGFASAAAAVAYRRARQLAAHLSDDRALFAAVWGTWLSTSQTRAGGDQAVRDLVDELFRVAEPLGDPGLRMQAHHAAWATTPWTGELTSMRDHVSQGLALYDRDKHGAHALLYGGHDPAVCGAGQGALALWMLGYPDQASHSLRRAIAIADELAHVPSVGHAMWLAGFIHILRRDPSAALEMGERLVALGRKQGFAQYLAAGGIVRGWARAQRGEPQEGLAEMHEATEVYRTVAGVMLVPYLVALAQTELAAGNIDKAAAAIADADAVVAKREEPLWFAGILRTKADLQVVRAPADLATAEQLYRQSLAMACSLKALSLELEAAIGLAKLCHKQGKGKQARDLLAPILGRFTEGFDTPDLIEATALLDETSH